MTIRLGACKRCGCIFPLSNDNSPDLCSECSKNVEIEREEFEWKNLTIGHLCHNGRCEL